MKCRGFRAVGELLIWSGLLSLRGCPRGPGEVWSAGIAELGAEGRYNCEERGTPFHPGFTARLRCRVDYAMDEGYTRRFHPGFTARLRCRSSSMSAISPTGLFHPGFTARLRCRVEGESVLGADDGVSSGLHCPATLQGGPRRGPGRLDQVSSGLHCPATLRSPGVRCWIACQPPEGSVGK